MNDMPTTFSPAPSTPASPAPAPPHPPGQSGGDIAALLGEPAARAWWRRWPVWLALAALLAFGAGAYAWQRHRLSAAAPSYTTQAVARGDLTLTVSANGTIQPTRSISIGSELSGTVRQVNVDVNDRIKKGDVLVVLDTARLRDQIVRSQAALEAAGGKLAQSGATLGEARAALGRFEEVARLSGGQVPSKAELDGARATLARAVADDASARAGIKDARAALSTDQINLSKASIVAPTDGVVLARAVDPGNTVAASLQAVTLLTVAEDLSRLRLWVYVDEADVGAIRQGQTATFTVSAYAARNYPAVITRVGLGSTITDSVVTYLTWLDVDNADLSLRPGMTATATITATRRHDVLLVPNAALRFSPGAAPAAPAAKKGITASLIPAMPGGGRPRRAGGAGAGTATAKQVWVAAADGKGAPVAVAVTPGISDGHMTEITGGDLKAGMLVITDQKSKVAK
jgi:HlyD family secretion protein